MYIYLTLNVTNEAIGHIAVYEIDDITSFISSFLSILSLDLLVDCARSIETSSYAKDPRSFVINYHYPSSAPVA